MKCKECEKLREMLFASNEREGKKLVENARLQRELELMTSRALQAEAKAQVQQ